MKAVLVAGLLALGALSFLPPTAAMELPPPCQTASMSTCCPMDPSFAPCCTLLSCPPPVACKIQQVDEGDVLAVLGALGPWGWVYGGPHFGVRLNGDCTVDAWESWDTFTCASTLLPLAPQELHEDLGPAEATVGACGVGFICACMPADVSPASAAELPNPCGPTALCQGPECPASVPANGLPVQVTLLVSGCYVFIPASDPTCPGPTEPGASQHVDGIVSANVETCRLALECTCDPLPIDPAAAAAPPCPEKSVSTTQFFAYLGPHATVAVHSDCTADASEHGLVCSTLAPDRGAIDRTVGPVQAHADTCVPDLDCTCPPLMAPVAAAAIPPPVEVEWVVCVTEPCDSPRIICHIAPRELPLFTVTVSESCHVTIEQQQLPCEAPYSESTTVGPVTVKRWSCGPGYPE